MEEERIAREKEDRLMRDLARAREDSAQEHDAIRARMMQVFDFTHATHCNALQRPATHCNALQRTAAHGKLLQRTATHCNALQRTASHCTALQRTALHCNALHCTATHCNARRIAATHCNVLYQHGAIGAQMMQFFYFTHCNALQHTVHILQHTLAHYIALQYTAAHCTALYPTATRCNTLYHHSVYACSCDAGF